MFNKQISYFIFWHIDENIYLILNRQANRRAKKAEDQAQLNQMELARLEGKFALT